MYRLRTMQLIVLSFTFCTLSATELCNQKEYALLGEDVAIDCHLNNFKSVYWYKGRPFQTPFVKHENGRKIISDEAKGHYDITDNGALLVKDVTEEQYDHYQIYIRYPDDSYKELSIELVEAVEPDQNCPTISDCDTCSCTMPEYRTFYNVTCGIHGSRPQLKLILSPQNDSHSHFNTTGLEETIYYDNETDTYDTFVSIGVYLQECNSSLAVYCKLADNSLFHSGKSTTFIYSELCGLPTENTKGISVTTVLVGLAALIVLIVLVGIVYYVFKQRPRNSTRERGDYPPEEMPLKRQQEENSAKSVKDIINCLITHLEDQYKQMTYVKPVPWGEDIPIESMYIDTQCEVSDEERKCLKDLSIFLNQVYPSNTDCNEMEVGDLLTRTLIVGDLGYGKTTVLQHLSCQWLKKSRKEQEKELLFLIALRDLQSHDCVADAICKMLPSKLDVSKIDLINLFKNRRCLLLLDGLDELCKANRQCHRISEDENDLTIDSILRNTPTRAFPNLRICVTSRNIDNANMLFSRPYTKAKLLPVTDQHLDAYIMKAIMYNWDRHKQKYSNKDQLAQKIKDVLDSHDLVVDFKKSPLLMVMFIHIILNKLINIGEDDSLSQIDLGKLSSLVAAIIVCLEGRYRQKYQEQETNFDTLKENLGNISLETVKGNCRKFIKYWTNEAMKDALGSQGDTALDIGYVKHTASTETDKVSHISDLTSSSLPGIVFIHDFIQEYCVSMYISKHKKEEVDNFINTVKGTADESLRHRRVLQFVSAIDSSLSSKVLNDLIHERCWDTVIDFLYEYRNDDVLKALQKSQFQITEVIKAKQSDRPRVFLKNLHRKYHRDAFEFFCKTCREYDVKLESFTFGSDCAVEYLLTLELSFVECIKLREMSLSDKNFQDVLSWACAKTKISKLILIYCRIPERVNVEKLRQKKDRKLKNIQNIVRSFGGSHDRKELNWKDGTWIWEANMKPEDKV